MLYFSNITHKSPVSFKNILKPLYDVFVNKSMFLLYVSFMSAETSELVVLLFNFSSGSIVLNALTSFELISDVSNFL